MPPSPLEPSWEDVLAEWVRVGIAKVHTSFPATVVIYDPATQRATVQPAIRIRIDDPLLDTERPELTPPPPIPNVPVVWPSGAAGVWSMHGPLVPGDPVTVLVAERSCDEWRVTGAPDVTPLDARRFDLTDAVCFPGGRTINASVPTGPLSFLAVDPVAVVLYVPAGGLKLGSNLAAEQALKGTTFEADLAVWLTAFEALLTVMATPGAPTVWVPAVVAAALTFQTATGVFKATVTSGIHRSLKTLLE